MKGADSIRQVVADAATIQKEHVLCDSCLGRLFAKRLSRSSNRRLGKAIRQETGKKKPSKCFICKDLIDGLERVHAQIVEKIGTHQFNSFLVGVILRPSTIERDDLVRSKYRLMGIDSVKTDISRQLAKKISRRTGSEIDHQSPELTITVNFRDGTVDWCSKSAILAGRYTKNSRNLPQRQDACRDCSGRGCATCEFHGISGFESVEGKIAQFLYEKFSSRRVRITWIGGEDRTSLVKGGGRPFFAQIINPEKRNVRLAKRISLDQVCVFDLRRIGSIPRAPVRFRSRIKIRVGTKDDMSTEDLKKLRGLGNSTIAIYEGSKRIERSAHSARYARTGPNAFTLFLEVDGGVPIKRFVDGETVFPNLSDLLGTRCVCKEFDFHEIIIQ